MGSLIGKVVRHVNMNPFNSCEKDGIKSIDIAFDDGVTIRIQARVDDVELEWIRIGTDNHNIEQTAFLGGKRIDLSDQY